MESSPIIKRPVTFHKKTVCFRIRSRTICNLSKDRILCGSYHVFYANDLILLKKTVYKDRVLSKSPDFNNLLSMFIIFGAFEFVDLRLRRNSLV